MLVLPVALGMLLRGRFDKRIVPHLGHLRRVSGGLILLPAIATVLSRRPVAGRGQTPKRVPSRLGRRARMRMDDALVAYRKAVRHARHASARFWPPLPVNPTRGGPQARPAPARRSLAGRSINGAGACIGMHS